MTTTSYGKDSELGVSDSNNRRNTVSCLKKTGKWMRANLLLVLTLLGILLGLGMGFLVRLCKPSPDTIMYVSFPGDIFLNMLKCLILPLIISLMITGSANAGIRTSGRIAISTVVYFLSTSILGIITGMIMMFVVHPGHNDDTDIKTLQLTRKMPSVLDTIMDLIRNLFPPNIFQALFESYGTVYVKNDEDSSTETATLVSNISSSSHNVTNDTGNTSGLAEVDIVWNRQIITANRTNVLGVILFCVVFGMIISKLGEKTKLLLKLFNALNLVVLELIKLVLWYSPVGLMFLIAGTILKIDNPGEIGRQLTVFTITAIGGLLIHGCLVLPVIYVIATRKNPYKLFPGIAQALVTAFGTSSSAATLPVTIRCLKENIGVDPRVTQFVLPIGSTINMDGTAVFMTMACMFIAQRNNIALTAANIISISLTTLSISIGAMAVPGVGTVYLLWTITAAGLPAEDITFMFAVDWLMERCRTVLNVTGDCFGTTIIAHLLRRRLGNAIQTHCVDNTESAVLSFVAN